MELEGEIISDAQLEAAEERGRIEYATKPIAAEAYFDRGTGRVVLHLINGCIYEFPAHLVQELQGLGPDQLAGVTVDGAGFAIRWPALDIDLYVPSIVAGIFGTRAWMLRRLAQEAGRTSTAAKAAAARANGKKGGRPRKVAAA